MVQDAQLPATTGAWSTTVTWGNGTWQSWSGSTTTTTNVVWGDMCGGANCATPWDSSIVTGTNDSDTVVWGMDDNDTVVWGMNDDDTVVWGMSCTDPSCEPVIWGGQ
jgi:hypothetical protein